ncbi:putative uncharacterized protein [Burkholderiales bacterium GJ-E10]|nr:putative uncharacterized protein [Burkholderiales bacterium GJ-E10]
MNAPPSLREVQRAWHAGIAGGDFAAALPLLVADAIPPGERLAIYRNTAASTLVNALGLGYPAVRKLVGEEFFHGTALAFLAGHWARTTWLDEYGAEFPDFLRTFEPVLAHPGLAAYLPDVAALERAVNHALHAPDVEALDPRSLGAVHWANAERLRFEPRPAIGFLRAAAPVDAIWSAVLAGDDEAMRAIDPGDGPVHLLVEWRGDTEDAGIHLNRMPEGAWRFARTLCAGTPLGRALEESAAGDPEFAAEAALAEHLAAGRFCEFRFES